MTTLKTKNVNISQLIRPLYRPVNEGGVENISASIRARGFDPKFAVVFYVGKCFFTGQEGTVLLGGEHRTRAADKAGLSEVPGIEEPAPKNKAEQLRRAMQLNAHTATDKGVVARQVLTYLNELHASGESVPKPETIAADLEVSVAYVVRVNAFRKRASKELADAFLTGKCSTFAAAEFFANNDTKAKQRERVVNADYEVPAKERKEPIIPTDKHAAIRHVSVVFGPNAADIVTYLTGTPAESDAAFARLKVDADKQYAADDAAAEEEERRQAIAATNAEHGKGALSVGGSA